MNFETPIQEIPEQEKEKKSVVWNKVKSISRATAIFAMLTIPAMEASAQEVKENVEDTKSRIEMLQKKAAEHVKNIASNLKEKGRKGEMRQLGSSVGLRLWTSPEKKQQTTVGYAGDEKDIGEKKWVVYESEDASFRIFDDGADGSVDRFIINKVDSENGISGKHKSGFNDLKTFGSMNGLAEEADITASLMPEKIQVYSINYNEGEVVIRAVDFNNGEANEMSGEAAENLTAKIQEGYTNHMERVAGELVE